ncbi:signal peptidase I [Dethiobacter alkaliphilus]|uniref:signal peptidase I n=1 Tax=Dethiobacter alkaliphilus TaxID=427926 RepID=UPI00222762D1|nr:signal peptidase I [Dethiobacter alkaliphilus]MCW3488788.1 signal peptidase I [Dethiobacter alkaliphilus]
MKKRRPLQRNHKLFLLLITLWAFFWLMGLARMPAVFTNTRMLTVVSGSMEPQLATGTIIAVNQGENRLFAPNDVITFHQDDILVTHRIIDVGYDEGFFYITKGDANQKPDPAPVRPAQVMGRVVFVVPSFFVPLLHLLRSPFAVIAILLFLRLRFASLPKKPAPHPLRTARKES